MESKSSLNRSIDGAAKHYSSMFSLPSFKKALFAVAVICFVIGLSTFVVFPSQGLTGVLVLGFSLFVLTLIADLTISKLLLRSEPIYSLRRTLVLSLFGWLFWLFFIFMGVALKFPFGLILCVKLSLLGYAVIPLKMILALQDSAVSSPKRFEILMM